MGLGSRTSQSINTPGFDSLSPLWIPHWVRNDKKRAFSPSGLLSAGPERTPSVTEEKVEEPNELRIVIEEREGCLCSQQINFQL